MIKMILAIHCCGGKAAIVQLCHLMDLSSEASAKQAFYRYAREGLVKFDASGVFVVLTDAGKRELFARFKRAGLIKVTPHA